MPKQNFKSHAKRKRELAKLDKRTAKDQKRAAQRAQPEAGGAVEPVATPAVPAGARGAPIAVPKTPLTLAEAVERWKNTKVVKAKTR